MSERTLRRAIDEGTIRCERRSRRGLRLRTGEEAYLLRLWPIIGGLRRLLRTEPNVGLAVLFGSSARGDDRPDSDIDVLVSLRDGDPLSLAALTLRLEPTLDRPVQLVMLEAAEASPSLLADILEEGRVLVDRDGEWRRLQKRYPAIVEEANAEDAALEEAADAAFAKMLNELGAGAGSASV